MSSHDHQAIYDAALAAVESDTEEAYDEQKLEDAIFARVEFDVVAEKRRIAKRIISERTKVSDDDVGKGQIKLPFIEPYFWQPDRLVRSDDGRIIQNAKAPLSFKLADLARANRHLADAAKWAERKRREFDEFGKWQAAEARAGRPTLELRFGAFIRESGYLIPPAA